MMRSFALLLSMVAAMSLAETGGARTPIMELPLRDATQLPDQTIGFKKSVRIALPSLPAKPDRIIVLRFRMVSFAKTKAGCNYNASLRINDVYLGRTTAAHTERLIGRKPGFEFRSRFAGSFQVFSGHSIMTMFAPDVSAGDTMTRDGLGATFLLDIGDAVRGVDGNTLVIENIRGKSGLGTRYDLMVRQLEVGYLDKRYLPPPANRVPRRGTIHAAVTVDDITLQCATGGGFAVRLASSGRLRVETALTMDPNAPSTLLAEDGSETKTAPKVSLRHRDDRAFELTAVWPYLTLVRTIRIDKGLVTWRETWHNTSDRIRGVPIRHRVFLEGKPATFKLGGDADVTALAASAQNPTLFLQPRSPEQGAFGLVAESDWLRLLMSLRCDGGVGEIACECLALAPDSRIDLRWTVVPLRPGETYWDFINGVRRRWGINGAGVERPIFWGFSRADEGRTEEERIRRSIGHLGPITLALGPWVRLGFDARTVRARRYPKLPEDAPRCPGGTPDLDLDAFLTFAHREMYWTQCADEVARIKKACPGTRIIQLSHPAMEVVYKPLAQRWPYADDVIRTAAGVPFESSHYSRAHLGSMVDQGWGVFYYVPRPGSVYLQTLLQNLDRFLDICHGDGIYFDEFSWAGNRRGYSRYDYSRWDGYSADLNDHGDIVHLKSDNAAATEVAQLDIVRHVRDRGKTFLGNGTAALRSINDLPIARFVEGGNGYGTWANAHLSAVPLVLGNFGDTQTRKGIFDAVKLCLSNGCVYSPLAVNLLLEGDDNFVCKLYPLIIRHIEAGTIVGRQRVITSKACTLRWPEHVERLLLYRYTADGNLEAAPSPVRRNNHEPTLPLTVPEHGLTIAEFQP